MSPLSPARWGLASALLAALAGLVGPACVCPPSNEDLLKVGFKEPGQAFETFRTAFLANARELELKCFSSRFRAENGLSHTTYREFRDELLRRQPFLRYGLSRLEVTAVDPLGPRDARVRAVAAGRTLDVRMVREDFYEEWAGTELVDAFVPDWRDPERVSRVVGDGDDTYLAIFIPVRDAEEADSLTQVRVGGEWKIDELDFGDGTP